MWPGSISDAVDEFRASFRGCVSIGWTSGSLDDLRGLPARDRPLQESAETRCCVAFATVAAVCILIPMGPAPLARRPTADPAVAPCSDLRWPRRSRRGTTAPAAGHRCRRPSEVGIAKTPDGQNADRVRRDEYHWPGGAADDLAVPARLGGQWHLHGQHHRFGAGGTVEAGYQIELRRRNGSRSNSTANSRSTRSLSATPDCGHALGFGNATTRHQRQPVRGGATGQHHHQRRRRQESFKATSARSP